jgi:integrase
VAERRLTAAAVNRPLALLRHLLRLAHEEWGELDVVPKIRTEKEPQGRLRWLTQEEATKLLSACKKNRNAALADLVEFSLFTGVRRGEALGLTWDRVDRARGVIRLELTKRGRRREVPSAQTPTPFWLGAGRTGPKATSSAAGTGIPSAARGRRPWLRPVARAFASTTSDTRSRPGWCSADGR